MKSKKDLFIDVLREMANIAREKAVNNLIPEEDFDANDYYTEKRNEQPTSFDMVWEGRAA